MPDVEKFFNAERTKKAKQAFKLMFQQIPEEDTARKHLQNLANEWRSQGTIDEFKKTLSLAAKILGSNPQPADIAPAINTAATNVSQALKLAKKIIGEQPKNTQIKNALSLASKILRTQKPVSLNKNATSQTNLNIIMERIKKIPTVSKTGFVVNEGEYRTALTYRTLRGIKHLEKNKQLNEQRRRGKKYASIWNAINVQKTEVSQPPYTPSPEPFTLTPGTRRSGILKEIKNNPNK